MKMNLIDRDCSLPLLVESSAFEGVKRIALAVAGDIELVTGKRPEVVEKAGTGKGFIFCGTLGKSPLLAQWEKHGVFSAEEIRGKREVYKIALVSSPMAGVEEALVICGSDKRGTIYGMFALSEYLGVTPYVYFGDCAPAKQENPVIDQEIETVSKEPSVRYRGFFINDEWPCFGNWACSHFGGVNSKMYEKVFEFLLRMKGNYLWPAMWASSFPLDGPGSLNEELADIYGVVMGYSHHEPCLRASEEWDKVRGEGTRYGNEWNFYTNEQGLLNYWEDSLKRSGKYENIITIGMRGERDSSMLGDQATVEENVNLLKDIIRKQRQLIRENVNEDLDQVPQMLALYKEVEAYFYGDENVAGLKDWDELDGVICMLCEDNFGHMRTLPTEEIRNHKGGFGMYYHFDYHGGPISYEWVDSTPLSKTWEQMCNAYEYGIRDLWIVNVGDLKFHEVPLSYFLSLAYDFDKWGSSNPESYREFSRLWAEKCFPTAKSDLQKKAAMVLNGYIDMNHMRRPESLNENIYHPCHYLEADRMLQAAHQIQLFNEELLKELPAEERKGYYSMVGFSAFVSTNLLKMHLYAKKSTHYANEGRPVANYYAMMSQRCMELDRQAAETFAAFENGKWSGMELAYHIGFTRWNDDGHRYPVVSLLHPCSKNRLSVSRKDEDRIAVKNYGGPVTIPVHDFMDEGCEKVYLEVSNDGGDETKPLHYEISVQNGEIPEWLTVSPMSGDLIAMTSGDYETATTPTDLADLVLTCDRSKLSRETETVTLIIHDGDTKVAVEVKGRKADTEGLPGMTFFPKKGVITMNAEHYSGKKDVERGRFGLIKDYGQYQSAMKVFPSTAVFGETEEKPELTYTFVVPREGEYRVEILCAPTNPAVNGQGIGLMVRANGEDAKRVVLVPDDFKAGENRDGRWCVGVLNQIRMAVTAAQLKEGINTLTIGALEAGAVLERIRIYNADSSLPQSYLGPVESGFLR